MNVRHFGAVLVVGGLLFSGVAAAWDIDWVDQFGNSTYVDTTGGSATDATGVYVAGSVFGALPGQGGGAGGFDAYLRKYDFAGNVLWTDHVGTPATEIGLGIATEPSGVYITGATDGTLPGQISAGGLDAFVRKYSAGGTVLWTRQFGTSVTDVPMIGGVATHQTGVYVVGETFGTFPGAADGNGRDIFLARLNAQDGQLLWVRQFGIRGGARLGIGGVSADDTGVYAAGIHYLGQDADALLRKYDFDGNLLWVRELAGTPSCGATFWGLATHDTNLYVVGQWTNAFFEDPTSCHGAALGPVVGVVLKYDSSGNLLWRRRLKGVGEGSFTGAKNIYASETGVYVSANLTTTFPGHVADVPRSDRSECRGLTPGNQFADKLDAYVRRYDFDGNVIWTHQFGSNVFDLVTGVSTDATGVYAAGDTSCQIDDAAEDFSGGVRDGFLLRIAIEPTSLPGQVQLIVGQLETLNDTGRFTPGEFGSLVQQLEATLQALDRENLAAARQTLEVFVRRVSTFESRGTLTPTETDVLIAAANGVIAQL
jgi:hypothetical protein